VYVIFRPNGTPCYVGKGRGRRAEHHARFSHNRHLKSIYRQADGILPLAKIREDLTDQEACEIERAFIAAIGRKDLGLGPLVNFCDGGEGLSGHIKSSETRAKLSAALKGKISRSPEWRAKQSIAQKGRVMPDTVREKISAGNSGKPRPWISDALRGRPRPDVRIRQLGSKNPDHSSRMKGNKNSAGKNTGSENKVPRKLTEDSIRDIRRRAASGERHQAIANDYGIHKSQISAIHMRRTWAWLP